MGLSAPTMLRIEQGNIPSGTSMAAIMSWLTSEEYGKLRKTRRRERALAGAQR